MKVPPSVGAKSIVVHQAEVLEGSSNPSGQRGHLLESWMSSSNSAMTHFRKTHILLMGWMPVRLAASKGGCRARKFLGIAWGWICKVPVELLTYHQIDQSGIQMRREKEEAALSSPLRCLAPACLEKRFQVGSSGPFRKKAGQETRSPARMANLSPGPQAGTHFPGPCGTLSDLRGRGVMLSPLQNKGRRKQNGSL